MNKLKLISSAAYLNIIIKDKLFERDVLATIVLADKSSSEPFYNKKSGISIAKKYLEEGKIIEEEFKHLSKEIENSSLTEEPNEELDEALLAIKNNIESLDPKDKIKFDQIMPPIVKEMFAYTNNKKTRETIN